MKHLGELRAEATEAARTRGHILHWYAPYHSESRSIQNGDCTKCTAEVLICTKPEPNGIDIGGSALAMNCEGTL